MYDQDAMLQHAGWDADPANERSQTGTAAVGRLTSA
jgi:hypothetical protein